MSRRTLHAWLGTLVLLGLMLLAYGLDGYAVLYGDFHGPVLEYSPGNGASTIERVTP